MKRVTKRVAVSLSVALLATVSAGVLAIEQYNGESSEPFAPKGYSQEKSLFAMPSEWDIYAGLTLPFYSDGTNNAVSVPNPAISPGEVDYLVQTSDSTSNGVVIGIDRAWMFANADKTTVKGFSLGVMFDTGPVTFSGSVNQTFPGQGIPNYSFYNYTYRAKPNDVALDADLYPFEIKALHLLPYLFVGGGFSAINLTYNQIPVANSGFTPVSASESVTRPLGLIGVGLRCNPTQHLFLKVQYLYHYRGSATLNNNQLQSGPAVQLNSQTVDFLAGLSF